MKSTKIALAAAALLLVQTLSNAAVVSVTMGSGSYTLRDNLGVNLTAGGAGDGNGALIYLGFYSDATLANPFGASDNNFIALTGLGNIFGSANTTIGDLTTNGAMDGQFFIDGLTINNTNPNAGQLPAVGTPLVVRVLDKQSVGASTHKMEFANASMWQWVSPTVPAPSINVDLDDANLRLLNSTGRGSTAISGGGPINANISLTPVPEPSSFLFGILTAMSVFGPRLRRRK